MATLFATVTLLLLGLCDARSLSVPSSERRTTCLMPPQPLLALRGGSSLEQIHTEDELDVVLDEAGSTLVVVDFYADWCGPCKKIAPTLEALAEKTPESKVKFYKVDVDASRELSAAQGVKSMPTIQFFRDGKKVHEIVGGDINGIKQEVAKATLPPLVLALKLDAIVSALVAQPKQTAMLLAVVGYLVAPWSRLVPAVA